MSDESRELSAERQHREVVQEMARWLTRRLQTVQYGEIGFTLVVHGGRIKHKRRIDDERCEA